MLSQSTEIFYLIVFIWYKKCNRLKIKKKLKVNWGFAINIGFNQFSPATKVSLAVELITLPSNISSEGLLANSAETLSTDYPSCLTDYPSCMQIVQQFEREGDFQSALDIACMAYGSKETAPAIFLIESISIVLSYGTLDDARLLVALGEKKALEKVFSPFKKLQKIVEFLSNGGKYTGLTDHGDDFLFLITGENWEVEGEHLNGQFFEKNELEIIKDFAPKNGTFLDIGANSGNHSIYCAVKRPDLEILPIEAEPRAVRILKQNVVANKLNNVNLEYLGKALNTNYGFTFFQWRGSATSTRVTTTSSLIAENIILKDILKENTFLKIDIEGMEHTIINQSWCYIEKLKPIMMVEVLDKYGQETEQLFDKKNLEVLEKIPIYDDKSLEIGCNWVVTIT